MELKEAIEMLKPLSKLEIYDDRYLLQEPHFDADCVRALNTVLAELDTITMNYTLLEEKFDGSAEEKLDKLTEELEKKKQVKSEMRKVAWEEGYNQGYLAGIRAVTLDEAGLDDEEE